MSDREEPVEQNNPADFELAEKEKRHEKRKGALEKAKGIDWDKIQTVDDLKVIVKDLFELLT